MILASRIGTEKNFFFCQFWLLKALCGKKKIVSKSGNQPSTPTPTEPYINVLSLPVLVPVRTLCLRGLFVQLVLGFSGHSFCPLPALSDRDGRVHAMLDFSRFTWHQKHPRQITLTPLPHRGLLESLWLQYSFRTRQKEIETKKFRCRVFTTSVPWP